AGTSNALPVCRRANMAAPGAAQLRRPSGRRSSVMTENDKVTDGRHVMTESELATLGGGVVAYIKTLTSDEASRMFPAVEGLPQGINLFSLHAADGTPLALTDTRQAAIGHAIDDDLEIASVH